MTTLIIILLVLVAALLAWVVKLLLSPPEEKQEEYGSGAEFLAALKKTSPDNEVLDVADQLLERIDQRIETLRGLIAEADEKIESLNSSKDYVLPAENPYQAEEGNQSPRGRKQPPAGSTRARIVALRRKGMAPDAIAREVNMGLGEVELILKIEGVE